MLVFATGVAGASAATAPADEPPVVDVLMLYTPAAERDVGGVEQLRAIAERGSAYTNQAFVNSRAHARTRVVGVVAAPDYNPDQKPDDQAGYDYLFDTPGSVAVARDAHRADVVGLFAFDSGAFANAAGPPLPTTSPGSGKKMLLDVRMTEREPDTYAHELGHLLGLAHDRAEVGHGYGHARGYVAPSMRWRDIMAYEDVCVDAGRTCPVIPYYTNPDLTHDGERLGSPAGQPDESDEVRVLNETAAIVAAYR